jgi:hypothetical protein
MKKLLFLAFVSGLITGCNNPTSSPTITPATTAPAITTLVASKPTDDGTWKKRIDIAQSFINDAQIVTHLTKNARAQQFMKKLRNGAIVIPLKKGPYGIARTAKAGYALMPILETDMFVGDQCAEFIKTSRDGKALAMADENNLVWLYAEQDKFYSKKLLGLVLLHEMVHIGQTIKMKMAKNSLSESEAYLFEFSLLDAMGGEAWKTLVTKEAMHFKDAMMLKDGKVSLKEGFAQFKTAQYQKDYESVYGEPNTSDHEAPVRSVLHRLESYKVALDMKFGKSEKNQRFLQDFYDFIDASHSGN